MKALAIGERALAIKHLHRCLELKPLEFSSTYELAKQLLLTGRRKECLIAQALALRAAKMALHDNRKIRAVDCYLLSAKAARKTGAIDKSVEYLEAAVGITPWLATVHMELACSYFMNGDIDTASSKAQFAFYLQPASIIKSLRVIFPEACFDERSQLLT